MRRLILEAARVGRRFLLKRSTFTSLRSPSDERRIDRGSFWALRGVTFSLDRGDSLAVIGRNGAGKSTLLRLLAGIARPTEGSIETWGKTTCVLDLGVGFHRLETGRENAETSIVLQRGLSRRDARRRIDEIAVFAGIGDFFDWPIRTYSDGMRLRLAFAILTVLEPELLISDEVLSVGDDAFQKRCNSWLDHFLANDGTLVLCTHDLFEAQRTCRRGLWLDSGSPRELGEIRGVVSHYRAAMGAQDNEVAEAGQYHASGERIGSEFEVISLQLLDQDGNDSSSIVEGSTVTVVVDLHGERAVPNVFVGITLDDLTAVYGLSSDMDAATPQELRQKVYRYRLTFADLPLANGTYRLRAHALDDTGTLLYDTVELKFRVRGRRDAGHVSLDAKWCEEPTSALRNGD